MGYTAPEILIQGENEYSIKADVWSLGITICEIWSKNLPFQNFSDPQEIEKLTIEGNLTLPLDMDPDCLEIVQACLNINPEKRPSITEIMGFKFFASTDWQKVRNRDFDKSELPYKPNPMKYAYLLTNKYDEIQIKLEKQEFIGTEDGL